MKEKNIYIMIGILFITLIVLIALFYFLSVSQKRSAIIKKSDYPQATIIPKTIDTRLTAQLVSLKYPIEYEGIRIELVQAKKQVIVYYKEGKPQAINSFNRFLSQYEIKNTSDVDLKIDFIGLTRETNEPPPGYFQ